MSSARASRSAAKGKRALEAPSTPKSKARKVALPPTPPHTPGSKDDEDLVVHTPAPPTPTLALSAHPPAQDPGLVHVPHTFALADARAHLEKVDPRFKPFFEKMKCKPFVDLEDDPDAGLVNPFRSLCTSIIGQQISWLAARAVNHRFLRIFHPELPEKYDTTAPPSSFPSPQEVVDTPMQTLRDAGLSQRKAEYIQDLAARFADGRLDPQTLVKMSDEEVLEALTAVRGIGVWTVQMFMIFTLRRPDVMPAGDLGIQKGLVKWWTSVKPGILARKLESQGKQQDPSLPTPPSSPIKFEGEKEEAVMPPFPESDTLTPAVLRSRLTKKIKGNIYLNKVECEALSESWKPYRSVGSFWLWALSEGE